MKLRRTRPILMGETLHVILRSDLASGKMSFRRYDKKISQLVKTLAKAHGVHIHKLANVGNHLHIHLRVTRRLKWKGFISGLTGGIARVVGYRRSLNSRDTREKEKFTASRDHATKFWNARPYTRTVSAGYDYRLIQDYIELNQLEADGVLPPRSEMRPGKSWRRILNLFRGS